MSRASSWGKCNSRLNLPSQGPGQDRERQLALCQALRDTGKVQWEGWAVSSLSADSVSSPVALEAPSTLPDTQAVPSPVGAPFPLLSPYSHNTVPPSPTCMGSPYPITKSHSFSRTLSHASSTEAFCNATALRVPALL